MNKQRKIVQMMIWELEIGFQELVQLLAKIPKEEAQWNPSPYSRTLETIKQWNKKGNEWIATQKLDPVSTIEYKVVHLAQCKLMYDEYAFREGTLNWNDLECPEWPHCVDYLKKAQTRLMASIQIQTDNQLEEFVPTNWGDVWPVKQIIYAMIQHDIYHFGQINTIWSLYKMRNSTRTTV
ncbi:MAG: DinB family protein [Candidatus Hodarchaeota archaeon]